MKKMIVSILLAAALVFSVVGVAGAITDGELDGEGHPFVGLMVAQDENGNPLWRCSGTLLSDSLYLTAGHCTESPAAHVEIWFDAGPVPLDPNYVSVAAGGDGCADPDVTGYPCFGDAGGTPYTHPDYDPNAFFLRDVGVVVLDEPYVTDAYGVLPALNQLDALKPGKKTWFTAVGYGLQESYPDPAFFLASNTRTRMVATPHLIQMNTPGFTGDFSLLLSNNHSTGGTCFGDSGGPNFLYDTNIVAGVTSFGLNGNCAGTGGVFRMDRQYSLDFVNSFLFPEE